MAEKRSSIPGWISLIYRSGNMYMGKHLKEFSIGKGQYIFLNALYKRDGISQEELSCYLKIDKGTTAKAIKKLEDEHFIIRKIDENDKRAYKIYLTEKALAIKPEVRSVFRQWRNILSSGFTEEEKNLALKLLEKMCDNAARYVDNEQDN